MSYDDLSDYVNAALEADNVSNNTVHDQHVWVYYLHVLDQSS